MLFVGILLSHFVVAQIDTVLQLPAVEVAGIRLRTLPPGEGVETWDSARLEMAAYRNTAELLSREGGVFIKSYGIGSSATSSIRGGSAGQTSVVWNGLPLQSPMLGQLDLSLLPVAFVDQLSVRYGGNGASWGSGAIGGVITIDNTAKYGIGHKVDLYSALGSFGRWDEQLKWQYGNTKFAGATRIFHQQATNDFAYRIRPDLPEKRQDNAAIRQSGVLQELYWKNRPNQELSLQLWGQLAAREIPPTSTQSRSEAFQKDEFVRSAVHWKRHGRNSIIQARTGLFLENMNYQDKQIGEDSKSHFWTLMGELDGQWQLKKQRKFQLVINQIYTRAVTDGYQEPAAQYRISLFGAFQQNLGSWKAQLSARQELVGGKLVALMPHLGLEGKLGPWLTIKGKLARNYRLPSLNDLYWRPGGNRDLLAEHGWSKELGFSTHWKSESHQLTYGVTGFSRRIHNWILWSLKTGDAFWSASNIAEVWSRGIEQRLNYKMSYANGCWQLSAGYDFTLSTNEKAIQNPKIDAGAQLFYVPKHQAFASLIWYWKKWNLAYQHRYTGPVTALNDSLKGYQVGNWQMQYSHTYKRYSASIFLQIDNSWNANYRIVERRPMPGRSFEVGVRVGVRG
ncbi:MAG: TonB-dependent receptor [Saprospiraceae bacterium]|nr:MAG: TonB-dependent receptor [Saprospiraceae bacterium]